MGGGYADIDYDTKGASDAPHFPASDLHAHPNLNFPDAPRVSATRTDVAKLIRYTLDCAARLVSPSPQLRGENAAFDCKDVAREIRRLGSEIVREVVVEGDVLRCPRCKLRLGLPEDFIEAHRNKGRAFYCPNSYCSKASEPPTRLWFSGGQKKLQVL